MLVSLASTATIVSRLTAGMTSFTSESWRRASIAAEPRPVPAIRLQDDDGLPFVLTDHCGKVMVIDFIYTRCTTLCGGLGAASARLARRLDDLQVRGDSVVLSLSFDPAHDTPLQLRAFKRAMEREPSSWRLARPAGDEARRDLFEAFGVVAIPDGAGGFDHNAALHVVDRDCRFVRVLDSDDVEGAASLVRRLRQVSS